MALTITWHGHSTFLFDFDGTKVLIDPFITNNPFTTQTPDDIDCDLILVTHAHGDHVGDTEDGPASDLISIANRTEAPVICNFEIGNYLMGKGVKNVMQGNPGGTIPFKNVKAKFTVAFHSSSFSDGTYAGQPNGFIIRDEEHSIYHAGDTGFFGDMEFIGDEDIEVAILPMGDRFTMGPSDNIRAVKLLRPKYVMPMHFNTFPPIAQNAGEWADRISRETTGAPIVLDPEKSYTIE